MVKILINNALVFFLTSILLVTNVSAEKMKVGIVDFQGVLKQMPEMATLQQKVEAEFKSQMVELQKLRADAKYNYDRLQREGATLNQRQQE